MRLIGLTGGIASGKSTVTSALTRLGIPVIDCDVIARQVVAPGQPALGRITRAFGEDKVLLDGGGLDRAALGAIIFSSKKKRVELGKIMGPAIQSEILKQVLRAFFVGAQLCVIDAPTLYETGSLVKFCGEIVVVACDDEVQLKRLMARDGLTEKAALQRVRAQLSTQEKIDKPTTTEVIWNNGTKDELAAELVHVVGRLRQRAGFLHRYVLTFPGVCTMIALLVASVWKKSKL
jgi:dephospho-CoA kinase